MKAKNPSKLAGLVLFFWIFLGPLLTLVHEVGHAIVPCLSGESVLIRIGGYEGPKFTLGNLTVEYAGPLRPWIGYTGWSGQTEIVRMAMGPLFSALELILFFALLKRTSRWELKFLFSAAVAWAAGALVVTALPFHYPSFLITTPIAKSDGKQIVDLLLPQRQ